MRITTVLPSAITTLRIIAIPFLILFLDNGNSLLFLALFLFSICTDLVDGYIARKWKASSGAGAYYDVAADFCLIVSVFAIFSLQGIYPSWILALIIISFALFVITSLYGAQIYDPIGQYWGILLFTIIAATVLIPTEAFYLAAQLVIAGFFVVSLATRIARFRWRDSPG